MKIQNLDELDLKLSNVIEWKITNLDEKLTSYNRLINSLSYKQTLKRGYAIVRNDMGNIISGRDSDEMEIEFYDNKIKAYLEAPKRRRKKQEDEEEQLDLF